jgi:NAD(P)-dependent dehydrogenase (short-subunit alcohol dehydrogenase family)
VNAPGAVVTGTSTGIGRATVLALHDLGFRVFAGVRRAEDGDALVAATSTRVVPVRLDVTDSASIAAAGARVDAALGAVPLAALVNNAGIAIPGPVEYVAPAELRRQLDINLVGQLEVTQRFLPLLRRGPGRIVIVSSLAAKLSAPFNGAYTASKQGVEAIGDALRLELRTAGIRVSIVEPGTVHTAMPGKLLRDGERILAELPPAGRADYGDAFRSYCRNLAAHARDGSPPAVVAAAIVHAVTARRPHTRYPAGAHARRLLAARRLLGDRAMDRIVLRFLGLPTAASPPLSSRTRHG